jgi:hypothetical protein
MLDKRVNKEKCEFSVPLVEGGPGPATKESRIQLDIIIGKVEERKWRLFKTYTQEKIVAIATGTLYKNPTGKNLHDLVVIGERDDTEWVADATWRDHAQSDVEDSEQDAVIDAVRELSLDVYENKTKMFGVDADTVFTQIMIGFIVGGDVPPPHPVEDPYERIRREMKADFIESIGGTPDHKL